MAEVTLGTIQNKIFDTSCASCHSGNSPPAGLRLGRRLPESELRDTLSRQSSAGIPYVTPGSTENSFLFRKVEGTHGALTCPTRRGCGMRMPPGAGLTPDKIDLLRRWINGGAPGGPATLAGEDDAPQAP